MGLSRQNAARLPRPPLRGIFNPGIKLPSLISPALNRRVLLLLSTWKNRIKSIQLLRTAINMFNFNPTTKGSFWVFLLPIGNSLLQQWEICTLLSFCKLSYLIHTPVVTMLPSLPASIEWLPLSPQALIPCNWTLQSERPLHPTVGLPDSHPVWALTVCV